MTRAANISIHVLRVEDDRIGGWKSGSKLISIHVLRVEDDPWMCGSARRQNNFNPRPPCGGRLSPEVQPVFSYGFQSTSSVWRTTGDDLRLAGRLFISIHVLRVEDDRPVFRRDRGRNDFNPRPPCGGRPLAWRWPTITAKFQSTSSVWRTTTPA